MEIVMYLDRMIVDSIAIESDHISQPGYVSGHIRTLRERHAQLIEQALKEVEFLLHSSAEKIAIRDDTIIQGKLF